MSKKVVAEHDYQGEDQSQLTFQEGDVISVLEEDDSGWWTGRLERTGQEGYFPETYVKPFTGKGRPPPPKGGGGGGAGGSLAPSKASGAERNSRGSVVGGPHGSARDEMYYAANTLNLKHNPNAKTRFGLAAHYMAMAAAVCSFFLGISGMIWGSSRDKTASPSLTVNAGMATGIGVYLLFISFVMLFVETKYGVVRQAGGLPVRAALYLVVGVPAFLTVVTMLAGGMWEFAMLFELMAYIKKESYEKKKGKGKSANDTFAAIKRRFTVQYYKDWVHDLRQQSKVRKYLFISMYVFLNVIYTIERAVYYDGVVAKTNKDAKDYYKAIKLGLKKELKSEERFLGELYRDNKNDLVLGSWFPVAKMFGNLLDINCAFILFPVCRSFIAKLYGMSTDQRRSSRILSFILSFMPLDKAIQWHKFMAGLIVVGTIFHGWAHYNHYAQVPHTYNRIYGPTVWVTGISVIMIMQVLYGTSFVAVRQGKFELFWYTHHLFIFFFLLTLFHGAGSINPNFWKWFIAPGALYILERSLREYKSRHPVGVVSVTHMNNKVAKVFCLELEKTGPIKEHQEGQYVFIMSPTITRFQWHPFTISSPPDQKTLTLHIRNMGEGTWTDRLQKYFMEMSAGKPYLELFHREGTHLVPQATGPDGKNLICIDGPMGCPTQHLGEYSVCMIIGSGIGVTPVRATLQSIIYYRFKRGIGQTFPDHAYCVWVVRHAQLPAYRWMARTLKEAEDELYDMRVKSPETMQSKTFQFHVFITRVPDDARFDASEVQARDRDEDLAIWGPHYDDGAHQPTAVEKEGAPFSEVQIYEHMVTPQDEPQAIGDIIVHKGRPNWPEMFGPVKESHQGNKIGVMFCGPEVIAHALKKNCGDFTDFSNNTIFKLHKENF